MSTRPFIWLTPRKISLHAIANLTERKRDHWFESSKYPQKEEAIRQDGFFFLIFALHEPEPARPVGDEATKAEGLRPIHTYPMSAAAPRQPAACTHPHFPIPCFCITITSNHIISKNICKISHPHASNKVKGGLKTGEHPNV